VNEVDVTNFIFKANVKGSKHAFVEVITNLFIYMMSKKLNPIVMILVIS